MLTELRRVELLSVALLCLRCLVLVCMFNERRLDASIYGSDALQTRPLKRPSAPGHQLFLSDVATYCTNKNIAYRTVIWL